MANNQVSHQVSSEHGEYVRVGDQQVYVEAVGSGEPVVLIHGLSGSGRWWAKNIDALSERYRIYALDLAGFGRSRAARRVALEESGSFLARWMEAVGLERASIIGHSMGGQIATRLAAEAPDLVSRLILVNAAALPISQIDMALRFGTARLLTSVSPAFLPVLVADSWRAGPVTVVSAARDLLKADIRTRLAQVNAPTLIVWGERDRLLPLELGKQLHAALPNARLEIIPNAGHNPMWDCPLAFNQVVLEFLGDPTPSVHDIPSVSLSGTGARN